MTKTAAELAQRGNNNMYALSQVCIVFSEIFFGLTYLTKKKSILLTFNVINNAFFGIHFLMLRSVTAAFSVFLTILFLIAIYILEECKKEKFTFVASIICTIALIPITIFTWTSALALLSVFAILLVFVGTLFKNLVLLKLFYFASTILNTIYMFIIHSYFGFALNLVVLTVAICGIIKQIKLEKTKQIKIT